MKKAPTPAIHFFGSRKGDCLFLRLYLSVILIISYFSWSYVNKYKMYNNPFHYFIQSHTPKHLHASCMESCLASWLAECWWCISFVFSPVYRALGHHTHWSSFPPNILLALVRMQGEIQQILQNHIKKNISTLQITYILILTNQKHLCNCGYCVLNKTLFGLFQWMSNWAIFSGWMGL